tara:strand:- start:4134 stop:4877 length:744 start_codon:yes stop_codon:yes gene_type:complete
LKDNILLLGGSGTLGSAIIRSGLFYNLKYPSSSKLNILDQNKIEKFIIKNKIKIILHFAGMARVKECEKNKIDAYEVNIIGTSNVTNAILNVNKKLKKKIKLVFMSSDAVYASIKGNYKETDKTSPYNYYGFTKTISEEIVKLLDNFIIIRSRFFDKKKIKFNYSAKNIYTSALEVDDLVLYIYKIINKNFLGIINVGGPKISDFLKYKKYKKNIKPCDKKKIFDELNFKIASDASLNLRKFKSLIK